MRESYELSTHSSSFYTPSPKPCTLVLPVIAAKSFRVNLLSSSYGAMEANHQDPDTQSSYQEYLKLKAKVDILRQSQRHYIGEEVEQLGLKEFDQLERQLDSSLRQVRSTKTKHMLDQLSGLQQKANNLPLRGDHSIVDPSYDVLSLGALYSWEFLLKFYLHACDLGS
ncbi:MADS-box protein-like protein isoform X1 [Tanacetum coccineum]